LLLLLAALCFVVFETLLEDPHYSVAIDSVSGLDPVLGSRPALDPAFNLTFHVASHGFFSASAPAMACRLMCPTVVSHWPLSSEFV
jgi:NAD(P)H-hydrate repair Nnr-like enzyme with NAD(P)H-hydrate epimerase domain